MAAITHNNKCSDDLLFVGKCQNPLARVADFEAWICAMVNEIFPVADARRLPNAVVASVWAGNLVAIAHSGPQSCVGSRMFHSPPASLLVKTERSASDPVMCAATVASHIKLLPPWLTCLGVSAITPAYAAEVWTDIISTDPVMCEIGGNGPMQHAMSLYRDGKHFTVTERSSEFGWS